MSGYHRCYAKVDLDAISHNIDEVRKKVGDEVWILAVIKADAYGHGAVKVADKIRDKVQYFAVATVEEAIELREAGETLPILILGYTSPSQYDLIVKYDITQTIYSLDTARELNNVATKLGKKGKIHIALDTGMTRIGFVMKEESISDVVEISKLENIYLEGMFSHFSCADMYDKEYSKKQMQRYDWFADELEKRDVEIPVKHLCNSAGIIEFESHRFNMVRAGIIIYGLYPSDEVRTDEVMLKPALKWVSHVVNVKTVEAGEGVSYGATFVTKAPTKIATISVGYADGYSRGLSNKGRVIIRDEYAPIIGRVCMDQMMVDVSHIPDVAIEDEVILAGKSESKELSVEEVSALSGSFNYEFVCDINKRVARIYD